MFSHTNPVTGFQSQPRLMMKVIQVFNMPKKAIKKKNTKRAQTGSASTFLAKQIGGIPQSQRRTLVYGYIFNITTASVGFSDNPSRLNSPYDPDPAFGGTSATGFAKYMQFYSKCYTLGAKFRVDFCLGTSTNTLPPPDPALVGITVTTDSTSLGSAPTAISEGLTKYEYLGSSPSVCKLENSINIGKFMHKPNVLDDPTLFCTASADPTQLVYLHAWVHSPGPTTNGIALAILIEYDCVFVDPVVFT